MDNRACLDLIEAALRPGAGLTSTVQISKPTQRRSEPAPATSSRTLAMNDDDDDNVGVDDEDDFDKEERLREAGIYTAEDALNAAVENAERNIGEYDGGFDPNSLHRLIELAVCVAPSMSSMNLVELYLLQRRLLRIAVPKSAVQARTVVLLVGTINSLDVKCKQLCLEWLLAVLDCVDSDGIRFLQQKLYFVFFHCLQYDALQDASVCILIRLTRPCDVLPFRVNKLIKLFERCGSQRVALLLCLYKRLAPDVFVLPFDPSRVLGSDEKISSLLAKPLLSSKAFVSFHDLVASKRGHPSSLPSHQSSSSSSDTASSTTTTNTSGATTTGTVTVVPSLSYFFSSKTSIVNSTQTVNMVRVSEHSTVSSFISAVPSEAPMSVWRCIQCPDHMASVINSPLLGTVASCCSVVEPTSAPRLEQWALHNLRRYCLSATPRTPTQGKAVVNALSLFGSVFRELPPCTEVFFSALFNRYNPLRRQALSLLQWVSPEAFPSSKTGCYAVLNKWLQPSLEECFHHRDMSLALLALASLMRRLSTCCCGNNPSYHPDSEMFKHTCLVNGQVGWSGASLSPDSCLLKHVSSYTLRAAGEIAQNVSCHAEVQDALLTVCEAFTEICDRCPECPTVIPRDLLLSLFHTSSAMALSRVLGVIVDYDKAGADIRELQSSLYAELCDRHGRYSLTSHPALTSFVGKFIEAVNNELEKNTESDHHREVTPESVLDDHTEPFLTFLAARKLTGLAQFFSRWPLL